MHPFNLGFSRYVGQSRWIADGGGRVHDDAQPQVMRSGPGPKAGRLGGSIPYTEMVLHKEGWGVDPPPILENLLSFILPGP